MVYESGEALGIDALREMYPDLNQVLSITINHTVWRKRQTINMIASENVMSPLAMLVYLNDMMHRYAEGKPYKRFYQGLIYVDELEVKAQELMGDLLGTKYVDLRPISGTTANATAFRTFTKPGDKAVVAPVQAGAHVSHTRYGTLGALGIEQIEMPFNVEEWNIDVDKARKLIEEVKPKIVTLGGSLYIFPHPTKEIAEIAHSVGAKVIHDVAHVLGLIVGGVWENPLKLGADVITSSTHKTFPGPQGGVFATSNEEDYKEMGKVVFPMFVSNHHLHRLAAMAVTAIEMKLWGSEYARQIVRNAKALAEALASEGFKVVMESKGYTTSHQVVVDVAELGRGTKVAKLLEDAYIIVNKNMLPWDRPEDVKDPSGLRLGTQELTRWGMKEGEMKEIARLMKMVVIDKRSPAEVKEKVMEFKKEFMEIHYGFKLTREDEVKLLKIMLHAET
ncbi:Glycine hydroxymethyltransferase [Desulfurococcus amylolyticus DSM 16532]|uniref:Serine hydroxymethyltransferase n=2 Tax=Desulfurococcus amylolyticus TaxID=94694 RepID=I3XRJ7_DESAM|nr:serine hydroxymethyltransferase [Desulfurococcus amylolyticus]AFL66571.1 Glycine hydroxymethyltransferase [Desulfurococcus amylolyticus DSM 16532]